jgi:hypothetical protein
VNVSFICFALFETLWLQAMHRRLPFFLDRRAVCALSPVPLAIDRSDHQIHTYSSSLYDRLRRYEFDKETNW